MNLPLVAGAVGLLTLIAVGLQVGFPSLTTRLHLNQGQYPGTSGSSRATNQEVKQGSYVSSILPDNVREEKLIGEIEELDNAGGISNGYSYQTKLTIKLGDSGSATYYFNQTDLARVQVFQLVKGKEQAISLAALKPNDRVVFDVKTNLSSPSNSNLLEFTITKL